MENLCSAFLLHKTGFINEVILKGEMYVYKKKCDGLFVAGGVCSFVRMQPGAG